MRIIEFIFDQELLTELFCSLLRDVVVLQFESDFSKVAIELMK